MVKLRLFVAWLLLAAIPLQGFAAVSMLLCEGNAVHATVDASASSMRAGHAMENDDHAIYAHAEGGDVSHQGDGHGDLPGSAHKCGVCASCCHGAAITGSTPVLALAPVPQADLSEPFVQVYAVSVQVPLKPPRV